MSESTGNRADLDEVDVELLSYIERNNDVNLEKLSEELGLSKSAVHYRLQKHRDEEVIQQVSADLDPLAFGFNMLMITEVSVTHEPDYATEIGDEFTEVPGVQQVYYTMGDVDFVVISRTQNREQMNDLINTIVSIDGINETSSRFVMAEIQPGGGILENISEPMRTNILDGADG